MKNRILIEGFKKCSKITVFILLCVFMLIAPFYFSNTNEVSKNITSVNAETGSYVFTAVSVTGAQASSSGGRVQINGGTISGEESGVFPYGTSVTVQAYANIGYEFTGWYSAILGGQLKTRNATFTFHMPSENTTYYAIFTINRYSISAVSSPSGAGNITGGGSHSYGTNVTLTATAVNSNYEFYRWIENSVEVSNSPSYSFAVSQNRALVVEFRVKVTVMVNGAGSVTVNGQEGFTSGYFLQTQNIILEANPSPGSVFVGWSNASVSSSPNIQVLAGTTAKTYVANFELIGAYLFVNATTGGSVTGTSASGTYPQGEVINLVATPNAGYHFLYWQGEFSGVLTVANAVTSYIVTLADVTRGNITLTAVFERDFVNLNLYAVVNGVVSGIGGKVSLNGGAKLTSITELVAPEKTMNVLALRENGYKFVGWYNALSGGQLISLYENYAFSMPLVETSLYAVFQLSYWHEYRITPNGLGTQLEPYLIYNENELAWLAYATNTGLNFSSNIYAKLKNNLNLSAYMWEPIGSGVTLNANSKWQGVFDGGGYVISGLNIKKQYNQVGYSGLFGAIYGTNASVKNLGVEEVNIETNSQFNVYVGVITGQLELGKISACYVKGVLVTANNIAGNQYVGAVAGASTNGRIENCYVYATIKTNSVVLNSAYGGALVGNHYGNNAVLSDCYSVSLVQNMGENSAYLGAVVGYNSVGAKLKNVFFNEEVTTQNSIGVNNATEEGGGKKTTTELKQFATYVNSESAWNFQDYWFMPSTNINNGNPVLRGIGNLIVTVQAGENGTITPSGQMVYFNEETIPIYEIKPNKNYLIKEFKVNNEPVVRFVNEKNAVGYKIESIVGEINLAAEFEVIPKEPINVVMLILLLVTPTTILIMILLRLFRKNIRVLVVLKAR